MPNQVQKFIGQVGVRTLEGFGYGVAGPFLISMAGGAVFGRMPKLRLKNEHDSDDEDY